MLPSASVEIHEAASKTFTELIQKELIPIHIFTTTCMSAILAQLDNREKCKEGERERESEREIDRKTDCLSFSPQVYPMCGSP